MVRDVRAVNFLVSSAGRRVELVGLLRQVVRDHEAGGGVFTADMTALAPAAYVSDGHEVVPACTDGSFMDVVLSVCAARSITDIVPTIDTELPVYSAAREIFERAGVRVWVSSPEAIAIAADKRRTNSWLSGHGLPVPRQWDISEAEAIASFPVIAKPIRGSSSVGLVRLGSAAAVASLARGDFVLEEIAEGDEYTVDVLVSRSGTAKAAVVRRRIETRGGEVSKGVTVRDADLADLAVRAAECLPAAYGVLNVQIFKVPGSTSGRIIEINARFGGGFPLAQAAGCCMPLWLLQERTGSTRDAPLAWREGIVMLRYDSSVFLDNGVVMQ